MSYNVYTLHGDGELDEGEIWEAAMSASHYKLDNLCAIVDRNFLQIDGHTEKVMALEALEQKWKSFGWKTIVIDGHNMQKIIDALSSFEEIKGKPTIIIAKTVKGKGVSFMENKPEWHGKAPTGELLEKALKELELEMGNEHTV
jgi:transketolase